MNEEINRLKKEKISLERRLDSKKGNQDSYVREVDDAIITIKTKDREIFKALGVVDGLIDTACDFAMWVNRTINKSEHADAVSKESLKALEEAIGSKQIKATHVPAMMDTLKGIIEGYINLLKRSASRASGGSRSGTPRTDGSPATSGSTGGNSILLRPISPAVSSPPTPPRTMHTQITSSPSRWQYTQENLSSDTKTLANLLSNLNKKTKQIEEMRHREVDILSMLAQQELELCIFKGKMLEFCGESKLQTVQSDVKVAVTNKYGGYLEFHNAA